MDNHNRKTKPKTLLKMLIELTYLKAGCIHEWSVGSKWTGCMEDKLHSCILLSVCLKGISQNFAVLSFFVKEQKNEIISPIAMPSGAS